MNIRFILIILFIVSCKNDTYKEVKTNTKLIEESLVNANKILVNKDRDRIRGFIKRHNWNMIESSTGLWYKIIDSTNGKLAQKNDYATLDYRISLLDGTECYSSKTNGYKTFLIGKGGVEAGLEQAILMLHVGDSARLILPPHLAHGVIGDKNKIPPRAIIIYEVKLLSLESK